MRNERGQIKARERGPIWLKVSFDCPVCVCVCVCFVKEERAREESKGAEGERDGDDGGAEEVNLLSFTLHYYLWRKEWRGHR
jgi:hypothetical protein